MGWGGAQGFTPVVGIFFFVGPLLLSESYPRRHLCLSDDCVP